MSRCVVAIACGLLYGLLMAFLGAVLGGSGHGWLAPFFPSLAGIVLVPATGGLFGITNRTRRISLARILVLLMLLVDAFFVFVWIFEAKHPMEGWLWLFYLLFGVPWMAMYVVWHIVLLKVASEKLENECISTVDFSRIAASCRQGLLSRDNLFDVLLAHADDPGWDSFVDSLSAQDRADFQQWACARLKESAGRFGSLPLGTKEHDILVRRVEQRGWLEVVTDDAD
jgi:hypothetical protein